MEFQAGTILDNLRQLRKLDAAALPFAEVKAIVKAGFVMPLLTRIHAGHYVERVRLNKDESVFLTPAELGYIRDLSKIKDCGRANGSGSSIFYGSVISSKVSLPHIVALAETEELLRGKEKGKRDKKLVMTISRWRIEKDMVLAEMVFSKSALEQQPEVRKARDFHLRLMRQQFPEPTVQAFVQLQEFFSEEFGKANIKASHDYHMSAAFAEVLYELGVAQGIIYPSVRTDMAGSNVALLPGTVDGHLRLEEARSFSWRSAVHGCS